MKILSTAQLLMLFIAISIICAVSVQHLIGRAKPDKLTADDLSAIKSAMATLESSSAHLMSLFDPNAQGSGQS